MLPKSPCQTREKEDKRPSLSHSPAFTIVELLIVVVVIAILAAISIVAYNGITNQAKDSAMASSLQQAAKKVVADYIQKSDTYPANLASIGITNSGDTTYQYFSNTNGYCITITQGDNVSHIAGTQAGVNSAVNGTPCLGHTGTTTVTAASLDCPSGFIAVPGNSLLDQQSFCTMKYEAKHSSGDIPVSQAAGNPWVSISQTKAMTDSVKACTGCHLITESQWMTIAANVTSVASNWSGGTVGTGYLYSGHNDNSPAASLAASTNDSSGYEGTGQTSGNQRRTLTLTNGEVIWDLAGNVYEWTSSTITGNQPGLDTDSSDTNVYVWKDWSHSSMSWNNLPDSSTPRYLASLPALTDVNTLSGTHGLGMLYSNQNQTTLRAFLRGGRWSGGSYSGVFALNLSNAPSYSSTSLGFRVSR